MLTFSSKMYCRHYILFGFTFASSLIYFVAGSPFIIRVADDEIAEPKELEGMKAVASEKVPEISRKDLMQIIKKSQYFQDIFSEQPDPMIIQFGHVCENPHEWEQRFEKRDFNQNLYQGKMRWGNKNGDYGEHYWDLGHAG